jgi:hypothetical protein
VPRRRTAPATGSRSRRTAPNGANGDARNDPATDDETAPPWQEATAAS